MNTGNNKASSSGSIVATNSGVGLAQLVWLDLEDRREPLDHRVRLEPESRERLTKVAGGLL